MKKVFLGIIFILVVFWGCGKQPTHKDGKVYVPFWHVMGGPLGDALDSLISEFNKTHPNIFVEGISVGNYQALAQKLMAAALTRPPVISQVYESWATQLSDVIEPIETYLDEDSLWWGENKNDFFPIFIKDNTVNGKILTFPFNKSVPAYYYNYDMFKENGIDSFPKTWDEFLKDCEILTKDTNNDGENDLYATAFNINVWSFENIVVQQGGELLKDGKIGFANEKGLYAINVFRQILSNHWGYLTTGFQHQNDFIAGKVAMVSGSTVSYAFMVRMHPPFDMRIAPIPYKGNPAIIISGTNIAIFKNVSEEQKRAAYEFIKWFTDKKQQTFWSLNTGYAPVRRSVLYDSLVSEELKNRQDMFEVYKQLEYAHTEPTDPEWFVLRQKVNTDFLEPVLKNVITPEEGFKLLGK